MPLAKNITYIPPTRMAGIQQETTRIQKTKVAAYCRVSTEYEEQESSYETQIEYYTSYINSKPEWELVEVYADDGISGTNTARRDAFKRMIEDCRRGKIDLILTKSISRFSRNTVDCLKYTRELKGMNIGVFFEKENINTLDSKGEVLMTIMAALAQQESESLSANVRLGIQFRNQMGKVQVNHNRFLGYTKDKEGNLIIVPEEAKIVKRIYAEYLDGSSFLQIKKGLEADGIRNGAHNKIWNTSNIKQILSNEKYIGDALLQKTFTINVLEKKRVANKGYAPKYYIEENHEPIIEKEVFLMVQAEMARRANLLTDGRKRVYSSKYALSSRVYCGLCGDTYRRIKWNNHGCRSTVWRCISRVEKKRRGTDCCSRTIKEEVIQEAVVTAVNDAWSKRDGVIPVLKENVRAVINKNTNKKLREVNEDLQRNQAELVCSEDEEQKKNLEETIGILKARRQEILSEAAKDKEIKERLEVLISFLDKQTEAITEYSEELVRRLIEKVTIYDEKLTVELKSGLQVDVEI